MTNKIQKQHLEAVDKINTFSPYDTNRDCKRAKMNDEIANKCFNITEDISIKFSEWIYNNTTDSHVKDLFVYNGKVYTIKELFNKFIEIL